MPIKKLLSYVLLVFIPISIAAEQMHWGTLAVFVSSALAIIPLAVWLSTATEEVAVVTGPSVGALLNAVFGNATELIIGLVALKAGLVDIVKASITGTIISNLLLAMGLSMLLGGFRYKEQEFKPIVARVNGSSMTLAVLAILLPTMAYNSSGKAEALSVEKLSLVVAGVLIIVYLLTLVFSLKTHSYLYDVSVVELEDEISHSEHKPDLRLWLGVLVASTLAVAYESEIFVGVVMDLNFNPFEIVAVGMAVLVSNLISLDGRSNWLEGALLLATYTILGAVFYFLPATT
jgi:Ca2+:H+ antiporter